MQNHRIDCTEVDLNECSLFICLFFVLVSFCGMLIAGIQKYACVLLLLPPCCACTRHQSLSKSNSPTLRLATDFDTQFAPQLSRSQMLLRKFQFSADIADFPLCMCACRRAPPPLSRLQNRETIASSQCARSNSEFSTIKCGHLALVLVTNFMARPFNS